MMRLYEPQEDDGEQLCPAWPHGCGNVLWLKKSVLDLLPRPPYKQCMKNTNEFIAHGYRMHGSLLYIWDTRHYIEVDF